MSEFTKHEPGSFSWVELATTDPASAKAFYSSLFGWTFVDTPAGPDMIYTRLQLRGKDVAALYPQQKEQREHGVPPNWMSYVTVESADRAAAKAGELGGTVLMEPFDVMEHGRMAIVQDPTSAILSLWQPRQHIGVQVRDETNSLCWNELYTRDTGRAAKFYSRALRLEDEDGPRRLHGVAPRPHGRRRNDPRSPPSGAACRPTGCPTSPSATATRPSRDRRERAGGR